jgi:hypothetical protein
VAHNFGSLVFTPVIKALQEKYGSRRQYARMEEGAALPDHLGPEESAFIAQRDGFYMATVGATGWPYVQHRGGPKGFLKVIDDMPRFTAEQIQEALVPFERRLQDLERENKKLREAARSDRKRVQDI